MASESRTSDEHRFFGFVFWQVLIVVFIVGLFVPTVEMFKGPVSLGRFMLFWAYVVVFDPHYWPITLPMIGIHVSLALSIAWLAQVVVNGRGRFSLKALIFAFFVVVVLVGVFREPLADFLGLRDQSTPLMPISTADEMEVALSSPYAVIFANVDWSGTSQVSGSIVSDVAKRWRRNRNVPKVRFYSLDMTNAQTVCPDYIQRWIASDQRLSMWPITGSGEVVWIKNGVVVDAIPTALDHTADELVGMTKKNFN